MARMTVLISAMSVLRSTMSRPDAITCGEDRAACEDAYWDWQCVEPFGTGKVQACANGCGDEWGSISFGDGDIDIRADEDECEDEADECDGVHAYGNAYRFQVMGEIGGEDEEDEGLRRREFCNAFGATHAVEQSVYIVEDRTAEGVDDEPLEQRGGRCPFGFEDVYPSVGFEREYEGDRDCCAEDEARGSAVCCGELVAVVLVARVHCGGDAYHDHGDRSGGYLCKVVCGVVYPAQA